VQIKHDKVVVFKIPLIVHHLHCFSNNSFYSESFGFLCRPAYKICWMRSICKKKSVKMSNLLYMKQSQFGNTKVNEIWQQLRVKDLLIFK